jgi:hypothetical protein
MRFTFADSVFSYSAEIVIIIRSRTGIGSDTTEEHRKDCEPLEESKENNQKEDLEK